MVLLLEALGVLVLICGAILLFVLHGRQHKLIVVACSLVLLLGCVGGIVFERGDLPFPSRAAPLPAATSLLFSGTNGNSGRMTLESLSARDGTVRWHSMIPFPEHTSPVAPMVNGTSIYVVGTDRTHQALVSALTTLYAFRGSDGMQLWTQQLPNVAYQAGVIWGMDA